MPPAPQMPNFNPGKFIESLGPMIEMNSWKMAVIVGILAVAMGYLIFLMIEEYKKNPLKFRRHKMGKGGGFKLSDVLRKKR